MPRTPILERRAFFDYTNRFTKNTMPLPWNAVDTALGTMVEPRNMLGYGPGGPVTQIDAVDAAFDSETYMDRGTFYSQYGTDGQQLLFDFDR